MGKKTKSMRGEIVDWDLAKVKTQMEQAPAPLNVQARQDFIDQKLRRRVKKVKEQISNLDSSKVDRKITEAPVEQADKIDEVKVAAVEKPTVTKSPAKKRPVKRKPKAKTETQE